MSYFTFSEKRSIPRYDDSAQVEWGVVEFDHDKCSGCGLCVKLCPTDTLIMTDKRVRMKETIECMMCSDCVAFCPEGAIAATRNFRYTGFYKILGFGDLTLPRL